MKLTLYQKYEKVFNCLNFDYGAVGSDMHVYWKLFKEYGWIIYITTEK
jgi:hypothetical protein